MVACHLLLVLVKHLVVVIIVFDHEGEEHGGDEDKTPGAEDAENTRLRNSQGTSRGGREGIDLMIVGESKSE